MAKELRILVEGSNFSKLFNRSTYKYLNKEVFMTTIRQFLNQALEQPDHDSAEARAKLVEEAIQTVYDFVKHKRPGGEGLDGKERQGLAKVLDEAINYKYTTRE
ncbi:hypothetical protein ACWIUA_11720 [Ursidibacter sp. B-7004-1]